MLSKICKKNQFNRLRIYMAFLVFLQSLRDFRIKIIKQYAIEKNEVEKLP